MGKAKQEMLNDYLYCKENGLPVWRPPISAKKAVALRNAKQHNPDWYEEMPDLMGEALAQAERDFLATTDLTEWEQLELDLWEGQHGIGTFTAWDLAEGGHRG